jgi:hypothetical protein
MIYENVLVYLSPNSSRLVRRNDTLCDLIMYGIGDELGWCLAHMIKSRFSAMKNVFASDAGI